MNSNKNYMILTDANFQKEVLESPELRVESLSHLLAVPFSKRSIKFIQVFTNMTLFCVATVKASSIQSLLKIPDMLQ